MFRDLTTEDNNILIEIFEPGYHKRQEAEAAAKRARVYAAADKAAEDLHKKLAAICGKTQFDNDEAFKEKLKEELSR